MAEKRESNSRRVGTLTVDVDCSEALKGLKAVTREAKRATAALDEFEKAKAKSYKLLVIELDSEESTPKVFCEGKEITGKVSIDFHWKTSKGTTPANLIYDMKFYETDNTGIPIQKGIACKR